MKSFIYGVFLALGLMVVSGGNAMAALDLSSVDFTDAITSVEGVAALVLGLLAVVYGIRRALGLLGR